MATRPDKLVITHRAALRAKYGTAGARRVTAALGRLVAADAARGVRTRVVALDDTRALRSAGARPIGATDDWPGALRAVDALWQRWTPAYVLLLGAPDVVPQPRIANPFGAFGGDDPDPYVPSDLPYACDLPDDLTLPPAGVLDPAGLLAVTRVVGRLPDLRGATDPAALLAILEHAIAHAPRPPAELARVFAVSCDAWLGSTTRSVALLGGGRTTVHASPPRASPLARTALARRTHFVNLHGSDTDPDWWGQLRDVRGREQPIDTIAMRPEDVARAVAPGTIAAAECCYGALHAAPSLFDGRVPMGVAYLQAGACALVGSSTTSYGPVDDLGQADLLCRFALEAMRAGASTGRALLEARQRFVRETGELHQADLKTLLQFDLLGDPSLVAVRVAAPAPKRRRGASARAAVPVETGQRDDRRRALAATGRALAATVARPALEPSPVTARMRPAMAAIAEAEGATMTGAIRSFDESAHGPATGARFHVAPVERAGRRGFVLVRERDGRRRTTVTFAKG
jgi:hypothetical protein